MKTMRKNREIKLIFVIVAVFFLSFLCVPMIRILMESFSVDGADGFNGLLLGYVIYTLPISFMLINNTMGYIDKKYTVVSRLMGDTPFKTFRLTVLQPLLGTLAASFIQTFFLCFTDFGIPASVGGSFEVIASVLYTEMLGSVPNFGNGAVVALVMLVPSVVSITVLTILERYNVRYNKISQIELKRSRGRDVVFSLASALILIAVFSVFLVMFLVPFVDEWPYRVSFTLEHVRAVFEDSSLFGVYLNSVMVAVITALAGTLVSYGAALVTARSTVSGRLKSVIESIALITNTIPGMVIGLAYLFCFSGTPIQNTFLILIICNMVHFFSTPYLMMKSSLSKMNGSWETTAMLMGDNWVRTIIRVVTPNAVSSLLEVFSYYFVNAMVTVSAVIFLAGAKTMLVTTKIKELQYFNQYNEIFVLSLLILFTNMAGKFLFQNLADYSQARQNSAAGASAAAGAAGKRWKLTPRRTAAVLAAAAVAAVGIGAGIAGESGSGEDQVVIYSNADDEAVQAMKNALDENGYAGDHIEDSGSAPLKKVRAGEAAVGFGLRQQAVADKGADSNEKAMEMAQCIIENGREELQTYYPLALYEGETTDAANISANPKVFEEPLTVDLLEEHQELSEECK
ncbi:MAG TPA: ABC transporter permease subunit [Candidatus Mediterraneibacter intestinavium]|nr:ABC transporter permease subunit [Candidatus Mediterraneibacter intestinavium]